MPGHRTSAPRPAIRALDVLAAMVIFYVLDGFKFGTSDDVAFAPWIHPWADPTLFVNDIRFGDWPNPYYAFHLAYMRLLANLMPIEWGLILSSVAAKVLLLIALQRLAGIVTGRYVSAVLLATLLVGDYYNFHFVGGYHLTSAFFSTHYIAIAMILMGIAWFMEGRPWLALSALVLATPVNPRLGLVGAIWIALIWYWPQPPARKRVLTIAAIVAGIIVVPVLAALPQAVSGGAPVDELLRTWMFVRSTGHYAPAAWRASIFVNILLVIAFLVVVWRIKPESSSRALCFAALVSAAMILVAIVNNYFLIQIALVFANPFQFGAFVLAIGYVFLASVITVRLLDGRYLSTLVVILAPDLQTKLLLLFVTIAIDRRSESRVPGPRGSLWPVDRGEQIAIAGQAAVILLARILFPRTWQQMEYALFNGWVLWVALASLSGAALFSLVRELAPQRLIVTVAASSLLVAYGLKMVQGFRTSAVTADTLSLCSYVSNKTPKDAVFVVPPGLYDFQYYCDRAAFFTFLHLPLRLERFHEWVARLKLLRVIPPDTNLATLKAPMSSSFEAYKAFSTEEFQAIGARYPDVRFIIVERATSLELPLAFENGSYRVYSLRQPS